MHWLYYVLIAAAVIVLLNVLLVVYLAIVNRHTHGAESSIDRQLGG
jgi:hypothetical protein